MNLSFTVTFALGKSITSRGGCDRVCNAGAMARLFTISITLPVLSRPIFTLLTEAGGCAFVAFEFAGAAGGADSTWLGTAGVGAGVAGAGEVCVGTVDAGAVCTGAGAV